MKIVAKGTLNRGEAGSNRAVGTFPKLLGLKDGRVLATYKVGPTKDSDQAVVELRWSEDLGQSWTEPTTPESPGMGGKRGALWTVFPTKPSSGHFHVGGPGILLQLQDLSCRNRRLPAHDDALVGVGRRRPELEPLAGHPHPGGAGAAQRDQPPVGSQPAAGRRHSATVSTPD